MIRRWFPLLCAVIKVSLLFILPECADALRSLSRSFFQFPFSLSLLLFLPTSGVLKVFTHVVDPPPLLCEFLLLGCFKAHFLRLERSVPSP